MKRFLAILLIFNLIFIKYSYSSQKYCYIQLLSTKNPKEAEKLFEILKDYPSTFLLKYRKYYTIRIGPFEDKNTCKIRSQIIRTKHPKLKLHPILAYRSYKIPSQNLIVKSFYPKPSNKNKKIKKEKAKPKEENNYLIYLEKAKICMGKKDCTNAIKYLMLAISKNPENPLLYTYLGYAYAHIGNYTKAVESFKKALRINPNYPEGYAGLGYLYLQLNSPNAAAVFFKKAHQLNPKEITYFVNYGIALIETQNYNKAEKIFKELKSKYPFIPEIYFNDAVLKIKTKNYEEAKKDLKIFIEMTKSINYYKSYIEKAQKLLNLLESLSKK